ncbi:MAG: DUF4142 domain-containing protein [Pedobacter sp.]|nr:MAG: DUF4142 domain-containing protein [Pedobacter sp.]
MKNFKFLSVLLFVALGATFQSCKKDGDVHEIGDQEFVTTAGRIMAFELAAANLVNSRTQATSVRTFSNGLITEHGKVTAEMQALAQQRFWIMPTELSTSQQANITSLTALNGAAFDKEFSRMMVASHQEAVDFYTRASSDNGTKSVELRMFADNKLPAMRTQLTSAQQLNTSLQ